MQFKEEGAKEYVDIARVPDAEMRPDRPVPPGCSQDGQLRRSPLDPIDIWPSSGALHPVRPGHNASRAYIWK